jgi:small subunit ribosomal protein S3Ae
MAKRKAKTKTGLKWKKKRWFRIESPSNFGSKVIGESLAELSSSLKGRSLDVSLMQLTGNIKKQNLLVSLRVSDVEDNVAKTEVSGFVMQTSSVKRLVRKKSSKIDDSFCCITKDAKKIRIKPLAVTRNKVSSGVRGAVRKIMIPSIVKKVKELNFAELIVSLTNFDLQKDVKKAMDKVYPLKTFQITSCKLETARKTKVVDETEIPVKEEEELISEEPEAVVA